MRAAVLLGGKFSQSKLIPGTECPDQERLTDQDLKHVARLGTVWNIYRERPLCGPTTRRDRRWGSGALAARQRRRLRRADPGSPDVEPHLSGGMMWLWLITPCPPGCTVVVGVRVSLMLRSVDRIPFTRYFCETTLAIRGFVWLASSSTMVCMTQNTTRNTLSYIFILLYGSSGC